MFERLRDSEEVEGVTAVEVIEPKTRRLADRLVTAFATCEFGLEPHRTKFGEPDYYQCPCCKSRMNVRGSAYSRRNIDDPGMTHAPDCLLIELKAMVDRL